MKTVLALSLCTCVLTLPPITLAAHDGEVHKYLKGTVQSVNDTTLVVKEGTDAKTVTVALKANTKYLRGTTPIKRAEVKVGERVVVGVSSEKEPFTAVVVRLGQTGPTLKEGAR